MKQLADAALDHIGRQGEDGFPEIQADWTSWACYGCSEEMRAPEIPKLEDFGSLLGYIKAKACSACAPGLISKHLPRDEILALAGVPEWERRKVWDPVKASNPGEDHLPRDPTQPGCTLSAWPYEMNQRHTITLTGPNGVGKSMLATQLVVQAFRTGVRSLAWFTCAEIVAEHFGTADWESKQKRDRAERCGCLVLDEYGRGRHSNELAYGITGEIIDRRKHHLTIITSNLSFPSTGDRKSFEETDSAVFDRLTEGLVVPMTGPSQRGRK